MCAALIGTPPAYADDVVSLIPWYPDGTISGSEPPIDLAHTTIPPFYFYTAVLLPHDVIDGDGNIVGSFDVTTTNSIFSVIPFLGPHIGYSANVISAGTGSAASFDGAMDTSVGVFSTFGLSAGYTWFANAYTVSPLGSSDVLTLFNARFTLWDTFGESTLPAAALGEAFGPDSDGAAATVPDAGIGWDHLLGDVTGAASSSEHVVNLDWLADLTQALGLGEVF